MPKRLKNIIFWLLIAGAVIYTAHNVLSTFVLMTFRVPTPSMEPTVMAGQHVIVNKMAYGRRIFSVPYDSVRHGAISRQTPMGQPRRGDIMVFNQTCHLGWDTIAFDIYKYFVKRCVALPGDTFFISNCRFYVKGHEDEELGLPESQDCYEQITRDTSYSNKLGVPFITLPFWDSLGWNVREFGPLYIPKKGDTIYFSEKNVRIYRKYIEWELGHKIIWDDRGFLDIDLKPIDRHVMQQNYYFFCGDNSPNSQDSRFWGLVPEEFIVGKVLLAY